MSTLAAVSQKNLTSPSQLPSNGVTKFWHPFGLGPLGEILQAFLHPQLYVRTYAYQYLQGRHALNAAGLWGHGLHASLPLLPFIQDNMVFNYLVYAFGWVSGLAIVALMIALLARVIWMSKKTSDVYSSQLVISLGAMFGLQNIYRVLNALGIVPLTGVDLPLLGINGVVLMTEFACLGVILSVYRRRNMVRRSSSHTKVSTDVE